MATKAPPLNYYEVLGVPRDADPGMIEAAYKAEIRRYRDQPGAGEHTRRISLAYRALINPERRREYDSGLGGAALGGAAVASTASAPPAAFAQQAEPSAGLDRIAADEHADRIPADEQAYHATDNQAYHQDQAILDDEPTYQRRSGKWRLTLLALGIGLMALLAVLASGLSSGDEQVAGRTDNSNAGAPEGSGTATPGSIAQSGTANVGESPSEDRSLAEVISSLVVPRPPVRGADEAPATSSQQEERSAAPAADGRVAATEPAEVNRAEPAANVPDAAEPAEEAPAPERRAPEPVREQAPPPPAPDRSAPARYVGGGLVDGDNQGGRFEGTVGVRIAVGANGRPTGCQVTRSSGNAGLDATTCRLLQQRLQFNPARDRAGNAVESEVQSTHVWGRRRRN